ncbi:hypothetical protein G6F56_003696 [Rhizopus delemar]|nr:hypothetical protein G6F56_003696 [Rhizopus delemar]
MPSFQDGGSSSITINIRTSGLHVQDRSERCLCSSNYPREIERFLNFLAPRGCVQIQKPSIWAECSSENILETHEVCSGTITPTGNEIHILSGRHSYTCENKGRDERKHYEDDQPPFESRVFDQSRENNDISDSRTIVFWVQVQHTEYVDSSATGKTAKVEHAHTSATKGKQTTIMQMDCQPNWQSNSNDSSDRRSTTTRSVFSTRLGESFEEQPTPMECKLSIERKEPQRTRLMITRSTTEKRNANSTKDNNSRHHNIHRRL